MLEITQRRKLREDENRDTRNPELCLSILGTDRQRVLEVERLSSSLYLTLELKQDHPPSDHGRRQNSIIEIATPLDRPGGRAPSHWASPAQPL